MDLKPLTSEEIEAIRTLAPWMKTLGSGYLLTIVVGVWKIFGLYKRLEDVEKNVKVLNEANLLTTSRHEELTVSCKTSVDAKIERAINELHLKWLDEVKEVNEDISSIKETQCHVLGELKQITSLLQK